MRAPWIIPLIVLAGCGGSGDRSDQRRATPLPPPTTPPPSERSIPGPSPIVPTEETGPAPRGAAKVIRAWAGAVRRADFDRAAALFARNAKVQNGGDVEHLETQLHAKAWNAALPCGATVRHVGGAQGYAIVRFRLTQRKGADCGTGTGHTARSAIRVKDGHITAWYRLPENPNDPRSLPAPGEPI